jgi:hypothetical protein
MEPLKPVESPAADSSTAPARLSIGAVVLPPDVLRSLSAPALFSPPAPNELLHAVGKEVQPRWRQHYRETARPAPASRTHAALALGALLSDISLAALARDTQHVRNLVQDVETLEKTLGVNEPMRDRISRLALLAESGEWESIRREIEAASVELASVLDRLRDSALARLLGAGAWMRALHIDAAARIAEAEKPGRPAALTGDFLLWLRGQWESLDESDRQERILLACQRTINQLDEVREREASTQEQISAVVAILGEFMKELQLT